MSWNPYYERRPTESLRTLFSARDPQGLEDYKALLGKLIKEILDKAKIFTARFDEGFEEGYYRLHPKVPSCVRKNLSYQFREDLLPVLRDSIISLCDVLDCPNSENKDLASIFRATLESMSQVSKALTQTMSSMATAWTPPGYESPDENLAKGLEEFESLLDLPWVQFRAKFCEIVNQLAVELNSFDTFLKSVNSLTDLEDDSDCSKKMRTVGNIDSVIDSIDTLLEYLNQSDFHIYKLEWRSQVKALSAKLIRLSKIINRAKKSQDPKNVGFVRLLNASISIIKLARLYLNKIAKLTNSQLHPVSQMNPVQKSDLFNSTAKMYQAVRKFIMKVTNTPDTGPQHPARFLADDVMDSFVKSIETLNAFFLSASNSHRPEVHEIHDWCLMWAGQFDVATKEFLMLYISFYHQEFPRMFLDGTWEGS